MTETPAPRQYTVAAYDVDHNRLWLDNGDVNGEVKATTATEVINTYTIKTGRVINSGADLDIEAGRPLKQRRRIAYFRAHYFGRCVEIFVNEIARRHGLRNYQMRRPYDTHTHILGAPALNDGPRLIPGETGNATFHLVQGEGDPFRTGEYNDAVTWFGSMTRATQAECGWSGWTLDIQNPYNPYRFDETRIPGTPRDAAYRALLDVAGVDPSTATGLRRS
jgi:hypothetical protein